MFLIKIINRNGIYEEFVPKKFGTEEEAIMHHIKHFNYGRMLYRKFALIKLTRLQPRKIYGVYKYEIVKTFTLIDEIKKRNIKVNYRNAY